MREAGGPCWWVRVTCNTTHHDPTRKAQTMPALPSAHSIPVDLPERILAVRRATAMSRLAAAREDYRRMMARVIPTPTYDAVAADLNFEPHMVTP